MKIFQWFSIACLTLLSVQTNANELLEHFIKSGNYEAFDYKAMRYEVISFNKDGQHYWYQAPILHSKFRKIPFNNKDIVCNALSCTIKLETSSNGEKTHLIVTKRFDDVFIGVKVFTDKSEKVIYSQSLTYDHFNTKSAVRNYIEQYQAKLTKLIEYNQTSQGIYGFWLGVLTINNKPELLAMEIYPDKTSTFTRFVSGIGATNSTTFEPIDVIETEQGFKISTSHRTFANQLILLPNNNKNITGLMYSYVNNTALQTSDFTLYKVRE